MHEDWNNMKLLKDEVDGWLADLEDEDRDFYFVSNQGVADHGLYVSLVHKLKELRRHVEHLESRERKRPPKNYITRQH